MNLPYRNGKTISTSNVKKNSHFQIYIFVIKPQAGRVRWKDSRIPKCVFPFLLEANWNLLSQTAATKKSCWNKLHLTIRVFWAVSIPYFIILSILQASLKSNLNNQSNADDDNIWDWAKIAKIQIYVLQVQNYLASQSTFWVS